ncbi:MAG: RNA polymerase sigma factor [Planctomycetaceae bacterium]
MVPEEQFAELMKRTRAGDEAAARELVRLYEPEIRRAARVRLTDPRLRRVVDSIDICQSVFGRFFRSATSGSFEMEKPEQLLGLLVTMTRNRVIDEHRRQTAQKRKAGSDDEYAFPAELAAGGDGPRTVAAARELLAEIRSRLTPDELSIAELRTAGQSWQEVSEELGEPAEALRKRLERALARVRDEVSQDG